MRRVLRTISDRLFDRLASKNRGAHALLALSVPALAVGLVVTVHSGDTLSGLAAKYCGGKSADWTGIYAANKASIGGNPDLIMPGQRLTIKCSDPGWTAPVASNVGGSGATSNESGPSVGSSPVSAASVNYTGSGAMQQCIISRESSGNSQVMNSSGHYGLYQFSYGTWVGSGGSPADFGNASVAEQNQVFYNAVAARGYSDWAPYDGC